MSGCGGFDGGQDERLMTTMPDAGLRVFLGHEASKRGVIPGKVIIGDWTWGSSHGPNGSPGSAVPETKEVMAGAPVRAAT